MTRRILLDGDGWRCKPYLGEEWRMRRAYAAETRDVHGWLPATVPGSVLADLVRAGEVPDPRVDRNSRSAEWVAARAWVYRRDVSLADPLDGRRVVLHLEGVDYSADVFWNGEHVGAHEGMFTPAEFDVTALSTSGDNVVGVVLAPAPDSEPQVGRTERVRNAKSRMSYGWDFCPRLIHLGLWDSAWLDVVDGVRITEVHARPHLAGDLGRAEVEWRVTLDVHRRSDLTVDVAVVHDGAVVAVDRRALTPRDGVSEVQGSVTVERPALWWPNGAGEQPLYELRMRAQLDGGGADVRMVTFGLRHVEVVPNEGAPQDARPYTFAVNGRKVYARGWNWVPMDVHHGVEDHDRLTHLIELAARAHVNLLRVWGGGLIEKEAFYDLCDRHGIMVWQEFPLSSSGMASQPSDDPEYVARTAREAEMIVPRRRNHPCLVLWCGGNELDGPDGLPATGDEPVLASLHEVVKRLDPDRTWLPTSPTGPVSTCTLPAVRNDPEGQHDVHGPWEHQGLEGQRTLYDRSTSLLHSEFGVEGATNLATLEAFVAPAHRWPADRSNPHWVHRGDWWINTPLVREAFGGDIDDLGTLLRASQLLQAEGLRYAVEANRRRQWRNSGSLPWQFNESFPNGFCTSAVDYCGRPKAAYYAVAEAYRPLHPSARFPTLAWQGREEFTAQLWVSSSHDHLEGARLEAALLAGGNQRHHAQTWDVSVAAGRSHPVATVSWALQPLETDVFWLDLSLRDRQGAVRASTRYLFSRTADLGPLLRMPPTDLAVSADEGALRVRNAGDVAAVCVTVADGRPVTDPGYARFSASHFSLMPGDERRVEVGWSGASTAHHRVTVQGWNTPQVVVA